MARRSPPRPTGTSSPARSASGSTSAQRHTCGTAAGRGAARHQVAAHRPQRHQPAGSEVGVQPLQRDVVLSALGRRHHPSMTHRVSVDTRTCRLPARAGLVFWTRDNGGSADARQPAACADRCEPAAPHRHLARRLLVRGRKEHLPSAGLVALANEFGITSTSARAALSRLARRGLLDSTKDGRRTFYGLTPRAEQVLDERLPADRHVRPRRRAVGRVMGRRDLLGTRGPA